LPGATQRLSRDTRHRPRSSRACSGAQEVLTNDDVLTATRTYTLHLCETRLFWGTVTVQAQSEGEELARERFELDWSNSTEVESEVRILAVN